jgi:20S proteasome alpha/beta subunit
MTVGLAVQCSDGLVVACDSLTTFGRGVPVLRYGNKVYKIEHEQLSHPVTAIAAGMTTFYDKFHDRVLRTQIAEAATMAKRKLDIVDFCERVCEPVITGLFKEYAFDRNSFLGAPVSDFSLSLIIAGATQDGELRAYFAHSDGLTERIEHYGTIGSGAAYAELFLRFLLIEPEISVEEAGKLAVYAVKGVELMDPHVGGEANVKVMTMKDGKFSCKDLAKASKPATAKDDMDNVLRRLSAGLEGLVEKGVSSGKNRGRKAGAAGQPGA